MEKFNEFDQKKKEKDEIDMTASCLKEVKEKEN